MNKTIILAAACAALTGCGSSSSTSADSKKQSLEQRWLIVDASGYSTTNSPDEAYIEFDGKGGVNGCTGANTFFGSYSLESGEISIEGVNTSRMGAGPYRETEHAVLTAMREAKSFSVEGNTVKLLDASGREVMKLVKD